MFVTFEGPEGAGKSTCIRAVATALRKDGYETVITREPGAGSFGAKVRALLLEEGEVVPQAELLLFLADRANHVATLIRPAIERNEIVLCDRYADSSVVYQGYARGLDLEFLEQGNRFATAGLKPDLTLLFDLEPEVGLERIQGDRERNRLDEESLSFHHRVRAGFLALAQAEPERWVILDANKAPEALASDARSEILQRLCR